MFTSFTVQILAVVAPHSSHASIEHNENSFLIPMVVLLVLVTIVALRRRRRKEREERTLDPRKDDYVLIPAGVYRVMKPASAGERSVTLCVDERQGRTILVGKMEIEGIVKPSIPPSMESHREALPRAGI